MESFWHSFYFLFNKIWETYGCNVFISTSDITTHQGCEGLLVESVTHGEIGGIFNLAAVLHDGILENQSADKFYESFAPRSCHTLS